MKILIADDSRVMRQIVTRTLRQAGYEGHDLVEAENGKELYDTAMAQKPDLVLSDWNMPEMNGLEALKAVRAGGLTMPFGFVTTEGTPEMRKMAEDAGALFLITKPFTAESFKEMLDPILG
ncbi:chemotaxis response regulator CheY [Virgisporangium ochraceum]|jgi:two-component system chemotaxis response regulator CheY|uniref:Response regulator n=1 Tax=Virgisporangium ochraceum TaxID=65505 RepID=A0A8J3ZVE0_9ACTN|nr:response regulator [Virgisporangium ochraceum]GIJ69843.1 response regulator [Virgisporangium ochraceum]